MVEVNVCIGSACHLKGSYNVLQVFQQLVEENALHDRLELKATFCMKQCENKGVGVSVDGHKYVITPEMASHFFKTAIMPALS